MAKESGRNKDPRERRDSKKRKDKRDDKPSFNRYRDDSRPSDVGSRKAPSERPERLERSRPAPFRKNAGNEDGDSERKKPALGKEEKAPYKKRDDKKSFERKPGKTGPREREKAKADDLGEREEEYSKPKPSYQGSKGQKYIRKPYVKKRTGEKRPVHNPERKEDDGMIRLNKYISNAGICSRREADDLIASGVVQVNGKTITEMGYRVKPTDVIRYGGQTLKKERLVYLILNKPKDYVTTVDDPQKRRTVLELVQGACRERIYPVGRLDRSTTGLLMFTNDGELTKKMTHPRYGVRKIYHVELDKPLKRADLDKIAEGLELEDGPVKVDEISYVGDGKDKKEVGVEIHSGKNRVVRRIFESLGYNVRKLDRVMFGPLTKKDLPRGRWRFLTDAEVGMLKMIGGE